MSIRRFATKGLVFAFSIFAISAAASAQEKRIEINPFFGYTFSDGVNVDPFILGGTVYDSINPMSGMSFGVHFGVFATENVEIGFLWSRQDSKLEAKGVSSLEITDMDVDNYHTLFTYNWGDEDAQARPFLFGGLGATQFSPAAIEGLEGEGGETQFSSTWGGGVKVYPSPSVGFTAMARWTPSYIKSDPEGVWCWYYCYVVSDADYANQFEFSGGVSFRF